METYDKLLKLTSDDKVELAKSFKDLIGKELCLGMTRYVCRNGTLSDGHEHITNSQRYYQAIKEMYGLGNNIYMQKALAMKAQADHLDAHDRLIQAEKKSDKLRAEADMMIAEQQMVSALVTVEDQMRQLDEFNRVRLELQEEVRAQYPHGIEQAEEDNWQAVMKYRIAKRNAGYAENLTHVPLEMHEKAKIGLANDAPELTKFLELNEDRAIKTLAKGEISTYLYLRDAQNKTQTR